MQQYVMTFIHRIIIYVVLVSVLRGLIVKEEYAKYFQFVAGMILVLFVASPILSVFSGERKIYDRVEEHLFSVDQEEIRERLSGADSWYEKNVTQACNKQVQMVVSSLARRQGYQVVSCVVRWKKGKINWKMKTLTVSLKKLANKREEGNFKKSTVKKIKKIVIDEKRKEEKENPKLEQNKTRSTGINNRQIKTLRRKLAEKFEIEKRAVRLWILEK